MILQNFRILYLIAIFLREVTLLPALVTISFKNTGPKWLSVSCIDWEDLRKVHMDRNVFQTFWRESWYSSWIRRYHFSNFSHKF